jgi:hypothetical protein
MVYFSGSTWLVFVGRVLFRGPQLICRCGLVLFKYDPMLTTASRTQSIATRILVTLRRLWIPNVLIQFLLRVAVSVHPQCALLVDLALPAEEEDIADGTLKATEICWRGRTCFQRPVRDRPFFCCEVRSIYCQDTSKSSIIQHIIFTFLIHLAIKIDIRFFFSPGKSTWVSDVASPAR